MILRLFQVRKVAKQTLLGGHGEGNRVHLLPRNHVFVKDSQR